MIVWHAADPWGCPRKLDEDQTSEGEQRYRVHGNETGILQMAIHRKILEWQVEHPNITWIGWGLAWALVLVVLFWPRILK
jgi:hypothetical protein